VVVIDSLVNGHSVAVERAALQGGSAIQFLKGDIRSDANLDRAWEEGPFDAVLHFAALKSVNESLEYPELYREVNVEGTQTLCNAMQRHGCKRLVFSSSAAVYGHGTGEPCAEDHQLLPVSPYGSTKAEAEQVIDAMAGEHGWGAISLRYFNPVGAHPSAEMGEDPRIRANLAPVLLDVAIGKGESLDIFGDDYPTPDGTCIRDYIHIMDLAQAHLRALEHTGQDDSHRVFNVGTGRGSSVLDVLRVAREITNSKIPAQNVARRSGDCAALIADVSRVQRELGWQARFGLREMLDSAWRWRCRYPGGYPG
jgi:UDP-glucose 4-epimerase